jgi:Uma2 family endonuclease
MGAVYALPPLDRIDDFYAWVEAQPYKHEMIAGRLVMMAGGSNPHSTIAVNAIVALRLALRGKPCRPFNSDFLVEIDRQNRYYPDVSVACGETRNWTDRPVLVIEVLSANTRADDFERKLVAYRRKHGLLHILYLEQDEPKAMLWSAGADATEKPQIVEGLNAAIRLPGLGIALSLADLYRDVSVAAG